MNKDNFIEEIKQNKNQMYTVALSILKNTEDAEDVVQEALLVAYEKLYTLKDDDKFKSWMMRIVMNKSVDELLREKLTGTCNVPEGFERKFAGQSIRCQAQRLEN